MTFLLLVFIAAIPGAMVGRRSLGERGYVVGGMAVGLVAGLVHGTGWTFFLAEKGLGFALLVFGMPPMLVGLCAGLATGTVIRRFFE